MSSIDKINVGGVDFAIDAKVNATDVSFDPTDTDLEATNTEDAIKEVASVTKQLNQNLTEKVNHFSSGNYAPVTGLSYDSTNNQLGLKVNGADTVIPFKKGYEDISSLFGTAPFGTYTTYPADLSSYTGFIVTLDGAITTNGTSKITLYCPEKGVTYKMNAINGHYHTVTFTDSGMTIGGNMGTAANWHPFYSILAK